MRYLLIIITTMLTLSISAQRGGERAERAERAEKIEERRIEHITKELDLSVEEAQAFWPLYNEYQKAKKDIGPDREDQKIDNLTEEEASVMLSKSLDAKRRMTDLEIEFMNKLESVLPAKKRLKLVSAERKFKKAVLKRYRKRMKRSEKMEKRKEKKEKHEMERSEEKGGI